MKTNIEPTQFSPLLGVTEEYGVSITPPTTEYTRGPVTKLDFALTHILENYRVFPLYGIRNGACECAEGPRCTRPGKHPRIRSWQRRATNDPSVILGWWNTNGWENSNVAIATGRWSNLIVLDIDNTDQHSGDESLERLSHSLYWWPHVPAIKTGRGRHLLFHAPSWEVHCSSGRLGPGIDVRGEGGYVVAEGSTHASGLQYEFMRPKYPIGREPFPDFLQPFLRSGYAV